MGQPLPPAAPDLTWGGKLPGHGDFVWSTPRTALRAQLEQWLHLGMLQGRSRYGEGWNHCLDQGMVWNFLLPARYSTHAALIAGCLAPSRDRVGRRYPLVVACSLDTSQQDPDLLTTLPQLVAQLGLALRTGIARTWPRETLGNQLETIVSAWHTDAIRPPATAQLPGAGGDILDILGQTIPPASNSRRVLCPWPDIARLLQKRHCPSLWWTNAATGASPRTVTYEPGLDPALLSSLFGQQTRLRPKWG